MGRHAKPHRNELLNALPLTEAQHRVLEVFRERAYAGRPPPTLQELCTMFGWSSTGSARDHVTALHRKGELRKLGDGSARSAALASPPTLSVPLVETTGKSQRGTQIAVPVYLVPEQGVLFAFQAQGSGMAELGILERDIILVGPRDADTRPRFFVGSIDGIPKVLHPRRPRGRIRVLGVVVGVMRSLVAEAMGA